jgi:hypothetical protein
MFSFICPTRLIKVDLFPSNPRYNVWRSAIYNFEFFQRMSHDMVWLARKKASSPPRRQASNYALRRKRISISERAAHFFASNVEISLPALRTEVSIC